MQSFRSGTSSATGLALVAALFTLNACDSAENSQSESELRSVEFAKTELETQYDESSVCADDFEISPDDLELGYAALDACLPDRPALYGDDDDDDRPEGDGSDHPGDRPHRPGLHHPFARPAIRACLPALKECVDAGGDRRECGHDFRVCVREFIAEHFDEICEHLLERCDSADRPPRVCERIRVRCEEGLELD